MRQPSTPSLIRFATILCALVFPTLTPPGATAKTLPKLKVSENRRFLVKEDGKPFFYLADTGWELFHRLSRDEAVKYLQNRADRKYSVIQAVALAELDGLNDPNAHGDKPLLDNDPTKPDVTPGADPNDAAQYDYWDHVDYVVDEAAARGIYTAMLPTWGDKWNKKWGVGPVVFTPANAETYGEFLGRRYKDKAIIWVLGGDRNPEADEHLAITRAMAKGLKKGDGGNHLMTFHPTGGNTSSKWFHADAWLDFNMQQNGHCADAPVWERLAKDRDLTPTKPVMDGEPIYEDHPICFKPKELGYSADYEVRRLAYWDVFSGAHGHTYGNHAVWQMYAPNRKPINGPQAPWYEAINRPGAAQMQYVRVLIESRPFLIRIPDQSVLASDAGTGAERFQATRGSDGSYAFVYSPSGKPFTVRMDKISGGKARGYWYDPRTGEAKLIGSFPAKGTKEFTPPSNGKGNDWVLVLDDEKKKFPAPGARASRT